MANVLANIFGSSPVQPLEKHVNIAYKCAKQLHGFFAASMAGDWDTAGSYRDEIEKSENIAEHRLWILRKVFVKVNSDLFIREIRAVPLQMCEIEARLGIQTIKVPAAFTATLVLERRFERLARLDAMTARH